MLWLNLIMDTFAALALATEPPMKEILLRQPCSKDDAIISAAMWRNILGHSCYQVAILVVLIFLATRDNWLVKDYQTDCLQQNGSSQCLHYNPYYSNNLYYTQDEVNLWQIKYHTGVFVFDSSTIVVPYEGMETQKVFHYTLIFNTFVYMQVFNQIDARKL